MNLTTAVLLEPPSRIVAAMRFGETHRFTFRATDSGQQWAIAPVELQDYQAGPPKDTTDDNNWIKRLRVFTLLRLGRDKGGVSSCPWPSSA